jgi:murein DD-endopeptidase MepM/ murein hydrolase activator NlpD
MSWIMPFSEKLITGHYGTLSEYRRKNGMQPHSGTDWAPKGKTAIPAIANGTVKLVQWSNVLGWVVVQTAATKTKKILHIGYCHLACDKHGIECKGPDAKCTTPFAVAVGQKLEAGKPFGIKVGNTGNASSGSHLHATLGKGVKDVFGPTTAKQDLFKAIKENA